MILGIIMIVLAAGTSVSVAVLDFGYITGRFILFPCPEDREVIRISVFMVLVSAFIAFLGCCMCNLIPIRL